jgi:hypothetical protein
MTWVETPSETFVARHDERDAADAERVLAQLEHARGRLDSLFSLGVGELGVVLHGSAVQLDAAQPWLPLQRALTAPAGRRYLVGWTALRELHVLAPRLLARRASNVEGSLEMLMLAPSALLARRYVGDGHPGMPPPFGPRRFARYLRWAWLIEGAAQYYSGQIPHFRAAVIRRMREGGPPAFPPSARDAIILGGTIFDLLERRSGPDAADLLVSRLRKDGARGNLELAFNAPAAEIERLWRRHLREEVARSGPTRPRRVSSPPGRPARR